MNKNCKKGFTIVELIIVIAVIAILAAVLIPTFSNLIKRANVANDTALVRNLNTALAADGAKQHDTMREALAAANAFGYDVSKINAKADGNEILWDSYNDCFVYKDESGINYIPDSQIKGKAGEGAQLWHIANKGISDISSVYSNYLGEGTYAGPLEVSTGLDVGDHTEVTAVEYTGKGVAQSVILYTNGGNLKINAANDTVKHYGLVSKVVVEQIHTESYHEFGFVTDYLEAKQGHLVIEEGASVGILAINGAATVKQNSGSELIKVVSVGSNAIDTTKVKVLSGVIIENTSITQDTLEKMKYGGGTGTEKAPYELYTPSQFAAFAKDVNEGKFTEFINVKLCSDVDLSGMAWEPIGNAKQPFYGSFDGQGKKISGLTNNGYTPSKELWGITSTAHDFGFSYGLFGVVGLLTNESNPQEIVLKNIKLTNVNLSLGNSNMVGSLLGADVVAAKINDKAANENYNGKITIENITTDGAISVTNGTTVGGIVGKLYTKGSVTVKSCVNSVSITASEKGKYAGIIGFTKANVSINNCENKGAIVARSSSSVEHNFVAGIATMGGNEKIVVSNCNNAAKLDVSGYVSHILQEAGGHVKQIEVENCTATAGDLYYGDLLIEYQQTKAGMSVWCEKVRNNDNKYIVRLIDALRYGYQETTGEYIAGTTATFNGSAWMQSN